MRWIKKPPCFLRKQGGLKRAIILRISFCSRRRGRTGPRGRRTKKHFPAVELSNMVRYQKSKHSLSYLSSPFYQNQLFCVLKPLSVYSIPRGFVKTIFTKNLFSSCKIFLIDVYLMQLRRNRRLLSVISSLYFLREKRTPIWI